MSGPKVYGPPASQPETFKFSVIPKGVRGHHVTRFDRKVVPDYKTLVAKIHETFQVTLGPTTTYLSVLKDGLVKDVVSDDDSFNRATRHANVTPVLLCLVIL